MVIYFLENNYNMSNVSLQCLECNQILNQSDYNESNCADSCSCGNIMVGIHRIENGKLNYFLTVDYQKSKPKIIEREDSNLNEV